MPSSKWAETENVKWEHPPACRRWGYLPWTADEEPGELAKAEMTAVCSQCPVLVRCATYAVTGGGTSKTPGRGVQGGFYAGVWIPWLSESGAPSSRQRTAARRNLRLIAGIRREASDND